jgi:hypothetical protein
MKEKMKRHNEIDPLWYGVIALIVAAILLVNVAKSFREEGERASEYYDSLIGKKTVITNDTLKILFREGSKFTLDNGVKIDHYRLIEYELID